MSESRCERVLAEGWSIDVGWATGYAELVIDEVVEIIAQPEPAAALLHSNRILASRDAIEEGR